MDLSPEQRKQIYDEEKARLEQEMPQPTKRPRGPTLRGVIVWAASALIVLTGAGLLAYQQYRLHDIKQRLGEAIGKDLGLTETILKVESESSKITFAELFELCNKSVEGRTNLIVELRGLHPEMDYQLKAQLIDYLNAENEFVRTKREFYTKVMQASSATDLYVEQLKDTPSSTYGVDYYLARVRQLKAKLLDAASEEEKSADDFTMIYQKMAKEESSISQSAHNAGLRFEPIFAKHAEQNQKKAKETKDQVRELALQLNRQPPLHR